MLGILNRMILWELVRVFALALVGLTGIFVLIAAIQSATQLGFSPELILRILPLTIPKSLPYTIPATCLFASCLVYGRLSADNETVVLKSVGVDLYQVLRPAAVFGTVACLATAALQYQVIPLTVRMIAEEGLRNPEDVLYGQLRREKVFRATNMPFVLYVREVDARGRLLDVVVKRRKTAVGAESQDIDLVARASEAVLRIEARSEVEDGRPVVRKYLSIDSDKWVYDNGALTAEMRGEKPFEFKLPPELDIDQLRVKFQGEAEALDWPDLGTQAADYRVLAQDANTIRRVLAALPTDRPLNEAEVYNAAVEVRDNTSQVLKVSKEGKSLDPLALIKRDVAERKNDIAHYENVTKFNMRQARTMELHAQQRPAMAVGCLLFALVGCPVGIRANRADFLSLFVVCFLPTVVVYYPLLLSGSGLARDGVIPVTAGVWAADAAVALAAAVLVWRLIKR